MTTVADQLSTLYDIKVKISSIIDDYDMAVPSKYEDYANTLSNYINGAVTYAMDDNTQKSFTIAETGNALSTQYLIPNGNYGIEDDVKYTEEWEKRLPDRRKIISFTDKSYEILSVGIMAFGYFKNLSSAYLPNVDTVFDRAFQGAENIKVLDLRRVRSFGNYVFNFDKQISSLRLGPFIENIGTNPFMGLRAYNDSYQSLYRAGWDIYKYGFFTLNSGWIVKNTSSLSNIALIGFNDVDETNDTIQSINGYAMLDCDKVSRLNYTALTSLASFVFQNTSLTSVSFPNLQLTNNGSFYICEKLAHIDAEKLKSIASNCFYSCQSLSSVNFPAATSIGSAAFYNCTALESISVDMIKTIGERAFNRCSALKHLYMRNITAVPIVMNANALTSCVNLSCHIPQNMYDKFMDSPNWKWLQDNGNIILIEQENLP